MAQLEFFLGERRLFASELRDGRIRIGRVVTCDLSLPSETVSRVHCTIDGDRGTFVVADRSTHGTAVNDEKLTGPRTLVDGDVVAIGLYRARFTTRPPADP